MREIFHSVGVSKQGAVQARHEFLVEGEGIETCTRKLLYFFENYQLVKYGEVQISEMKSIPAESPEFWERVEASLEKNRTQVKSFIGELSKEGIADISQLESLPQGYQSKTLHTLTHLLDGFFGIDSYFFNLPEGSHSLSENLRKKILADPKSYMLLSVTAAI